jgi:hypothetical protein
MKYYQDPLQEECKVIYAYVNVLSIIVFFSINLIF